MEHSLAGPFHFLYPTNNLLWEAQYLGSAVGRVGDGGILQPEQLAEGQVATKLLVLQRFRGRAHTQTMLRRQQPTTSRGVWSC